MKRLQISLSNKSINDAIQKLEAYRDSIDAKMDMLVNALVQEGVRVIDERYVEAVGADDYYHYTYVKIASFGSYRQATIVVEGKDIMFIEFGAGIHYNGEAGKSPHPLGDKWGYTIGSYGKGLGKNDHWYYKDSNGDTQKSYGTLATMPVYSAAEHIKEITVKMAREIFK